MTIENTLYFAQAATRKFPTELGREQKAKPALPSRLWNRFQKWAEEVSKEQHRTPDPSDRGRKIRYLQRMELF